MFVKSALKKYFKNLGIELIPTLERFSIKWDQRKSIMILRKQLNGYYVRPDRGNMEGKLVFLYPNVVTVSTESAYLPGKLKLGKFTVTVLGIFGVFSVWCQCF